MSSIRKIVKSSTRMNQELELEWEVLNEDILVSHLHYNEKTRTSTVEKIQNDYYLLYTFASSSSGNC